MTNDYLKDNLSRVLRYFNVPTNRVLLGYWFDYQNANAPQPGIPDPPYLGEPMPNEYLDLVLSKCLEYYGYTYYSQSSRYSPADPAVGEIRYRDCSSFVWDVFTKVGFNIGPLWYTGSQFLLLRAYEVSSPEPGDMFIYWNQAYEIPPVGSASHTGIYIGNEYYIDCTGHTKSPLTADAVKQRTGIYNPAGSRSSSTRFFRIPPEMYP